MRWLRKGRVMAKTGTERLADADREVELSRQRLRDTQEQVVKPLRAYAERNSFAEIIAQSLAHGHRRGTGR